MLINQDINILKYVRTHAYAHLNIRVHVHLQSVDMSIKNTVI